EWTATGSVTNLSAWKSVSTKCNAGSMVPTTPRPTSRTILAARISSRNGRSLEVETIASRAARPVSPGFFAHAHPFRCIWLSEHLHLFRLLRLPFALCCQRQNLSVLNQSFAQVRIVQALQRNVLVNCHCRRGGCRLTQDHEHRLHSNRSVRDVRAGKAN